MRPQDIDSVKRGQHAMVRLTALNQRITPMIAGEVIYVSADALPDEKASAAGRDERRLYRARQAQRRRGAGRSGFQPTPGMPAEVHIKTTDRTFFEYLTRPIHDSMARAFRER